MLNNSIKQQYKNSNFKSKHQFHLVDSSPLPIVTALWVSWVVTLLVFRWHPDYAPISFLLRNSVLHSSVIFFFIILCYWFIEVIKESGLGYHTPVVQKGLRLGMILFIVSEIMFFFAFFWAFFHFSLAPAISLGCVWPPITTQPIDVWGLPLVNTLLLLSSGVTITIAHHIIIIKTDDKEKNEKIHLHFAIFLLATIFLGIAFLLCQAYEYNNGVTFDWKENVYGTSFFVTTGFHGFHVTLGTMALCFCFAREIITEILYSSIFFKHNFTKKLYLSQFSFTAEQHLGFEAAAWYWHFVDVVWLFLFITIYWWGN